MLGIPGRWLGLVAAAALALYEPDAPRWNAHRGEIARELVSVPTLELKSWIDNLAPVGRTLADELESMIREAGLIPEKSQLAFGSPPQAVIVSAVRPLSS